MEFLICTKFKTIKKQLLNVIKIHISKVDTDGRSSIVPGTAVLSDVTYFSK